MKQQILNELISIVGKDNVLSEWEDRICYSYDATMKRAIPSVVVFPITAEEIAKIMQLANRELIPVFPRGAGTGLSGGAIAAENGISLVMTRMNKILEINNEDLLCVVQPGVVTADLQAAVDKVGLFYPPDPNSLATCTIGGNVAENAGGPRAFKYGVTTDFVLGLEVVTPIGEIMCTGGRTVKNVTGYDITSLLTGSEGTLGIITEITLSLLPKPAEKRTALVGFDKMSEAAHTVSDMVASGVIPATLEIMDKVTIRCVENSLKMGLPLDVEAVLLIEVDGRKSQVEEEIILVEEVCRRNHCVMIKIATNEAERNGLWAARRAVSGAVIQLNPTKISEDATVPRSKIPAMVERVKEISQKYDIHLPLYGHAGDGNLHPTIVTDSTNPEEMARVEKAIEEIFHAALEMNGTLSGEHGIGILKRPFLVWEVGEVGLRYLQAIKKAVDPNNILNPGKVI